MHHLNPTRSEQARQTRLRQEARCLKYWILKVRAARFVLALALFLAVPAARADDGTGLPEDPKDASSTHNEVMTMSSPFLPLPGWSRFEKMPPLPEQLTPLGKKAPVVAEVTPVVPRKDPGEVAPAVSIPKPKEIPVVNPNPTLVAVSPFLEWIKDHPAQAAEQARKEASAYNPAPNPPAPATSSASATAGTGSSRSPYWMPPLIDSSDTTAPPSSTSTTTTGSSAAIYSTPQKN